ncbi:MAG: hypothetical protein AVDCRST_MAG93-6836 [uncultured Chloroflexia bacterium]|uniref:Uncharacterized protein n=1 Tax=uncultured Chloroflexia bacterium TaxID=1672391 RepID=A0A6J4LZA3_9CHLR|nr:MAG: hypothetical protein AVDCRST_MAG93-6836 [uncultured Chloroflexia bacterium]
MSSHKQVFRVFHAFIQFVIHNDDCATECIVAVKRCKEWRSRPGHQTKRSSTGAPS